MLKNSQFKKEKVLCWNEDAQVQALRIEPSNGDILIIPYVHLLYINLGQVDRKELLTLFFTSHEIQITGRILTELADAFQRFSVKWIKPCNARYADSIASNGVIEKIAVIAKGADD